MYTYRHTHIHTHTHTYTHTHTHTYSHTHIQHNIHTHKYTHMYTDRETDRETDRQTHTHTHTHTHRHTHTYILTQIHSHTHTQTQALTHMHAHTHTHTYTHTHTHTHTHTYTHTHTHTHTHTLPDGVQGPVQIRIISDPVRILPDQLIELWGIRCVQPTLHSHSTEQKRKKILYCEKISVTFKQRRIQDSTVYLNMFYSNTAYSKQWRIYIVKFWTRTPPPPPGPNSLNCMQFWEILANRMLTPPPWRVGAPSSWKSWIRHCW